MKAIRKTLLFVSTSSLLLGLGILGVAEKDKLSFEDPLTYETPVVERYQPLNEADGDDPSFDNINTVIINYYNDDLKNSNREIYTWIGSGDALYNQPVQDDQYYMHITLDYNGEAKAYKGKSFVNFIVKEKGTWAGQSEDILLDFNKFGPDANGVVEVWTAPGIGSAVDIFKTKAETQMDKVKEATFTDWKTIKCKATATPTKYRLYAYDKAYLASNSSVQKRTQYLRLFKEGVPTSAEFEIKLNYTAHVNIQYAIETEYSTHDRVQTISVTAYNLYETNEFKTYYTYDGNDLGVTYSKEQTTFKVWAPTAGCVQVNVYKKGTPKSIDPSSSNICDTYFMTMGKGGVWEKTLTGDLNGLYYTYTVVNSAGTNEVCDPYAKACGVNGIRGMILDFSTTNPEGWDELPLVWDKDATYDISTPQQLSIYEVHIRDLTSHESWNGNETPGTYKAFMEKGTRLAGTSITTGFDHLEEMNINAIQLMPVFDQDNDELPDKETGELQFNWGYNPLNYNCVEGAYSSDPTDGAVRIKEYKSLILALAKNANHARTIMDVVYNHVSSASNSNFTKLMPRYYFRYDEEGNYYDGSGCSNEVKSDAKMMSKFIVDSLTWWASEYKIKGFRFDLMGLIDAKTLEAAQKALYLVDPDIYIYGEGWTAGGYHGPDANGSTYHVYRTLYKNDGDKKVFLGGFNDSGRNAIKGGNDGGWGSDDRHPGYGFISQGSGDIGNKSGSVSSMMRGINDGGEGGANPAQTINYASCHDNYTLYDQLSWTLSEDGGNNPPRVADVITAATSIECMVMLSNGVAFMQGGEELFRTKVEDHPEKSRLNEDYVYMYNNTPISHNSYKSSDKTNGFDYTRKQSVKGYNGTINTSSYWKAMAKAIKLRNNLSFVGYPDNCGETGSSCNGWDHGEGSTMVSFQLGSYFFFFSGRNATNNHNFGEYKQASKLISVGDVATWASGVKQGKYSFSVWKR